MHNNNIAMVERELQNWSFGFPILLSFLSFQASNVIFLQSSDFIACFWAELHPGGGTQRKSRNRRAKCLLTVVMILLNSARYFNSMADVTYSNH
jgi:hypothetical protein